MSQVKLILVESVHSLGEAGDLVNVKPGFARNFLLPQGKAILATEGRVKELEHNQRIAEEKAAREYQNLQAVKKKLESLEIEIGARAGQSGKLFGSVTAPQIAEAIEAQGQTVDRRRIDLGEPIKEVGEHKVSVKLLRELVAELTVKVVAEGALVAEEEDVEVEDDDRGRGRRGRREEEDEEGGSAERRDAGDDTEDSADG